MVPSNQAAAMPFHGGPWKMGNIAVSDGGRLLDPLRKRAQAGPKHDGDPRADRDPLADGGGRLLRFSKMLLRQPFLREAG